MTLRMKGDINGAAEEFKKVEELNKALMNTQVATLATNAGAKQLRAGDIEGSISKFRLALKLAPDFAPAHYQLALALLGRGRHEEALAEFGRAHQLDPRLRPPLAAR